MRKVLSLDEKLWRDTTKRGDDECWEFGGRDNGVGYGHIHHAGKSYLAHRVSYTLHYRQSLVPSTQVCHRCDNRRCVNPKHLFLGTNRDNRLDCVAKGRSPHTVRRYSEQQVREIHRMHIGGMPLYKIARELGAARSTVQHMLLGTRWHHIYEEFYPTGGPANVQTERLGQAA